MDKTDAEWEAEDDARTLIRAQELLADPKRLKKASVSLKKQSKAAQDALVVANAKAGLKKALG